MSVRLKTGGGEEVVVLDKPLYDEVVVEECSTKFFATKVLGFIITLHIEHIDQSASLTHSYTHSLESEST